MQPEQKSFFARGGSMLVAGIALALVSVVFSLIPVFGGPDPFTLIAGPNATFQLREAGSAIAICYLVVVMALIARGLYRLIESAHVDAQKTGQSDLPKGTGGMHPAA